MEAKPIVIIVQSDFQVARIEAIVGNLPKDGTMQVTIEPVKKVRTQSQNDRMWAGLLRDFEEQGWVDGQRFDSKVWHEYLKERFLPEGNDPDINRLVKDVGDYQKWSEDPGGRRKCIGSTKKLTRYGFARYIEQVEAYGATELGIHFSAAPGYEV